MRETLSLSHEIGSSGTYMCIYIYVCRYIFHQEPGSVCRCGMSKEKRKEERNDKILSSL